MRYKIILTFIIASFALLLTSCRPQELSMTGLSPNFTGGNIISGHMEADSLQLTVGTAVGNIPVSVSPWTAGNISLNDGKWELKYIFNRQPYGVERQMKFFRNGKLMIVAAKNVSSRVDTLPGFNLAPGKTLDGKDETGRTWTALILKSPDGSSLEALPGEKIILTNTDGSRWAFILIGASKPPAPKPGVADETASLSVDFYLIVQ